jgi:hypothetical protein
MLRLTPHGGIANIPLPVKMVENGRESQAKPKGGGADEPTPQRLQIAPGFRRAGEEHDDLG